MPSFEVFPQIHHLKSIPADYVTNGDLDLRGGAALYEIGPNLRVGGSLWLGGVEKPEPNLGLTTDKDKKHFSQCQIRALPEGLAVNGSAYLQSCPQISRLPATMRVAGDLELRGGEPPTGCKLRLREAMYVEIAPQGRPTGSG